MRCRRSPEGAFPMPPPGDTWGMPCQNRRSPLPQSERSDFWHGTTVPPEAWRAPRRKRYRNTAPAGMPPDAAWYHPRPGCHPAPIPRALRNTPGAFPGKSPPAPRPHSADCPRRREPPPEPRAHIFPPVPGAPDSHRACQWRTRRQPPRFLQCSSSCLPSMKTPNAPRRAPQTRREALQVSSAHLRLSADIHPLRSQRSFHRQSRQWLR